MRDKQHQYRRAGPLMGKRPGQLIGHQDEEQDGHGDIDQWLYRLCFFHVFILSDAGLPNGRCGPVHCLLCSIRNRIAGDGKAVLYHRRAGLQLLYG